MRRSTDYAEIKADILDRLGVENLLQELGVEVTSRSGNYFQAHCPLSGHDDQNPSFSVNEATGSWRCFGCDRSGSVFDLWSELKGLAGFQEAVKELAGRAGVDLPRVTKKRQVLTVADYARSKGLPEAWLRKYLALRTLPGVSKCLRSINGECRSAIGAA